MYHQSREAEPTSQAIFNEITLPSIHRFCPYRRLSALQQSLSGRTEWAGDCRSFPRGNTAPSSLVSFRSRPELYQRPGTSGCLISWSSSQHLRPLCLDGDYQKRSPPRRPVEFPLRNKTTALTSAFSPGTESRTAVLSLEFQAIAYDLQQDLEPFPWSTNFPRLLGEHSGHLSFFEIVGKPLRDCRLLVPLQNGAATSTYGGDYHSATES